MIIRVVGARPNFVELAPVYEASDKRLLNSYQGQSNCRPMQLQLAREHKLTLGYKLQRRTYYSVPILWLDKDWIYLVLLA